MKTNNQKLKLFLAVSFLGLAVITAPLVSSADSNNQKSKQDYRVEAKSNTSFWGKMFGKFFGTRAQAKATLWENPAPSISSVTAPTVLKTGQVGTWAIKASEANNGSLGYAVDWGEKNQGGLFSKLIAEEPVFVQTSTFTHSYSKAGTYTVKFTVSNETGQSTTSTVTVHVTGNTVADAPIISDVTATSNKPHQANIKWATDVKATGLVWYSKTSPVNTSANANVYHNGKTLKHSINLTNLEANTTYYVVVGSKNKAGVTKSNEISFKTPAHEDTYTPVITSLSGNTTVVVGEEETVTVNAYDPKNGSLSYSADWGDTSVINKTALSASARPIFVQGATLTHVYNTPGTYTATFTVENNAGNKTSSSMKITVTEPKAL